MSTEIEEAFASARIVSDHYVALNKRVDAIIKSLPADDAAAVLELLDRVKQYGKLMYLANVERDNCAKKYEAVVVERNALAYELAELRRKEAAK